MEEEVKVNRSDLSGGTTHFIFRGEPKDGMNRESKRVIRAILTALEDYTNFNELDSTIKKVVRSAVLDNVNSMKRTAIVYLETAEKK